MASCRHPVRERLDSEQVGLVEAEGADLDLAEHDGAIQEDHDALAGQGARCGVRALLDVVTDAGQVTGRGVVGAHADTA